MKLQVTFLLAILAMVGCGKDEPSQSNGASAASLKTCESVDRDGKAFEIFAAEWAQNVAAIRERANDANDFASKDTVLTDFNSSFDKGILKYEELFQKYPSSVVSCSINGQATSRILTDYSQHEKNLVELRRGKAEIEQRQAELREKNKPTATPESAPLDVPAKIEEPYTQVAPIERIETPAPKPAADIQRIKEELNDIEKATLAFQAMVSASSLSFSTGVNLASAGLSDPAFDSLSTELKRECADVLDRMLTRWRFELNATQVETYSEMRDAFRK